MSGDTTAFNVTGLKPFTLYNISMIARNRNGESLPTYSLRVMTHSLNQGAWSRQPPSGSVVEMPVLPDTRGCCLRKNITHKVLKCNLSICDDHASRSCLSLGVTPKTAMKIWPSRAASTPSATPSRSCPPPSPTS